MPGMSFEEYAAAFANMAHIPPVDVSSAETLIYTNPMQSNQHIKQYNYIPDKFIFNKLHDEEELYLGAEIEIDNGGELDEIAEKAMEIISQDNVYCKRDGSLTKGFEIVTHPKTLEYHKSLPYKELFDFLTKNKYRAHDTSTCGLHVHFNRNYFGDNKLTQDLCISKLLYLFEKFWEKVIIIARRDSSRYANRFYLREDETPLDIYAKSVNANKYGAINLLHKDTVEIRIYKGTLSVETFFNTLEFTKVMVSFAKDVDIYNIQNIVWEDIVDKFSDELVKYIKDRESKQRQQPKTSELIDCSNATRTTNETFEALRSRFTQIGTPVCTRDDWSLEYTAEYSSENETTLKRKISDLKLRLRRCRNSFETRSINQEITRLSTELAQLRRRNRNPYSELMHG